MVQEQAHRPNRHRRLTLLAGCALAAIALTACGSSGSSSSGAAAAAGGGSSSGSQSPKAGGQATVIEAGMNSTFDPALNFISTFTDGPEMEALYGPGLVYQNAKTGAVEMGFAQSLTDSQGGKVWTMVLHPGLKFSDGTAFNAQAVVDNINRIANPATGSTEAALAKAIQATAVNATTVQFTLDVANTQFPSEIAQDFALIPSPTAITKEGSAFGSQPVGPGPFMMGKLTPSVSLALVRNPNYSLFAPNEPYLDSLTFEEVTSSSQVQADMSSGQAQVAAVTTGQQIAQMQSDGMTAITSHPVGGAWLDINEGKAPFNNVLAREAVFLALNRTGLANVWAQGNPVSTNYFPTSSPYYDSALNWPSQDSAKAQQLFNQLAAEGQPVTFTILWPTGTNSTTAQYVASSLNAYKNVHVSTSIVLPAQYTVDLNQTQNYQMTAYGYYNSALFPITAQVFQTGGALNYEKISDPKIDAAIKQMQSTTDPTVVKQAADSFVQELINQYDIIPAQQGDIGFIYNPKSLAGVQPVEFGMIALWGQMYSLNP
jgi:ABC-type transport system substrate-binding protein